MKDFRKKPRNLGGGFRSEFVPRDSDRRPKRDSRDRKELELFAAVCSKCGKDCEVPFKPTNTKPVYCRDCFRADGGEDRGSSYQRKSSSPSSSNELDIINMKLDKIMHALKIN